MSKVSSESLDELTSSVQTLVIVFIVLIAVVVIVVIAECLNVIGWIIEYCSLRKPKVKKPVASKSDTTKKDSIKSTKSDKSNQKSSATALPESQKSSHIEKQKVGIKAIGTTSTAPQPKIGSDRSISATHPTTRSVESVNERSRKGLQKPLFSSVGQASSVGKVGKDILIEISPIYPSPEKKKEKTVSISDDDHMKTALPIVFPDDPSLKFAKSECRIDMPDNAQPNEKKNFPNPHSDMSSLPYNGVPNSSSCLSRASTSSWTEMKDSAANNSSCSSRIPKQSFLEPNDRIVPLDSAVDKDVLKQQTGIGPNEAQMKLSTPSVAGTENKNSSSGSNMNYSSPV